MEEELRRLGLTNNEIGVYIALLGLGSAGVGEIIKSSKLHRAAVYDTLDRLAAKGLASYVISANRKKFQANRPGNLMGILDAKEAEIKEEKKNLLSVISSMEGMRKLSSEPQETTLFKGSKGITSIFNDMLSCGKEVFAIGAYSKESQSLVNYINYMMPSFHKKRVSLGIPFKFIFPEQSRKRAYELKKMKLAEVRILPAHFASITSMETYGDKVAIIIWIKEPVGLIIRSKEFADNQREYFKVLWNIAKPA
jgi:sugar-specific transcriptional regulator TrmB